MTATDPVSSSCGSVIVTFNPDMGLFEQQLCALLPQVGAIAIIDNGSSEAVRKHLYELRERFPHTFVEFLPTNQGIAFAQNLGTRLLLETNQSIRYVLYLDHDSVPSPNLVSSLFRHAESLRAGGRQVAAVGARLVEPRTGQENGFYVAGRFLWGRIRCGQVRRGTIPCMLLNSSGSFHPVDSLKVVGPFDESMFIDLIDTDWYFRARHAGYQAYGVCDGQLNHYMGDSVVRYWLLGWRTMPRRTPLRHYYITRNSLMLYSKAYVPLSWKLSNMLKLLLTLAFFFLFDHERADQGRFILRGVRDAIRGRRGSFCD